MAPQTTLQHRDQLLQLARRLNQSNNSADLAAFGKLFAEYLAEASHINFDGFRKREFRGVITLLADVNRYRQYRQEF